MNHHSPTDTDLVRRIRAQEPEAWEELIAGYERRLLAFAEQRLSDRAAAEDVVQETFLGFLRALPNYDSATPVEAFLFAIAAHKMKDVLRQRGRRPWLSMGSQDSDDGPSYEPAGKARRASTLARSAERHSSEEIIVTRVLRDLVHSWYSRGEFERMACAELLFVLGWANKEVAAELQLSEQVVANHKQFIVQKLKAAAKMPDAEWQRFGISD